MDSSDRAEYLKKRRADALANGTCTTCYKRPARPGVRQCQECADASAARGRRRGRIKRSRPRATTIPVRKLTRAALAPEFLTLAERLELDEARPHTRAECADVHRPCPWVGCKHHLFLDVNPETGSIKLNFPDLEPWELAESCSLDVAERGAITLEEVGMVTNLTRERVRQVEVRGLMQLKFRARGMTGR